MAKNGTKVDELYLALGLDLSQFDIDMATADKTVAQAVKDLSSEKNRVKLRMEIDAAKLEAAGNSFGVIDSKIQHTNEMLALQKTKVDILSASYQKAVQDKGEAGATGQLNNLLREQKAYAELQKQVTSLNKEKALGKSVSTETGVVKSIQATESALTKLRTFASSAKANIAALFAFSVAGGGIIDMAKSAITAGDSLYILSTKMHMSVGEAGLLNRVLKLSGVEAQSFMTAMIKLDRQVMEGGLTSNGNMTTNTLKEFGISLTDATGRLLPYNQQLSQLAKGYQEAAKSGQEEEFISQLGARGFSEMVPLLQDYVEKMEDAQKVATTGIIDPKQAHEAQRQLNVLSMEAGQLQLAFAAALIPVANDLAPSVIDGLKDMVGTIKDNRDEIKEFAQDVVYVAKPIGELAKLMASAFMGAVSVFKSVNQATGGLAGGALQVGAEFLVLNKLFGLVGKGIKSVADIFKTSKTATKEAAAEIKGASDATKSLAGGAIEAAGSLMLMGPPQVKVAGLFVLGAKAIWDYISARKEAAKAPLPAAAPPVETGTPPPPTGAPKNLPNEEILKAQKSLQDELYKVTHDEKDNELHDLDEKYNEYRAKLHDSLELTEWYAAARAKIEKKYNDEILKKREELEDKIFKVTHTAHENALHDVERESKNMKKPDSGYDPVLVDKLASAERSKIAEDDLKERQSLADKIYKLSHDEVENEILDVHRQAEEMKKAHADSAEYVQMASRWEHDSIVKNITDAWKKVKKEQESVSKQYKSAMEEQEKITQQTYDRISGYVSGKYGDVVNSVKNVIAAGGSDSAVQKALDAAMKKHEKDQNDAKRAVDLVRSQVSVPSEVVDGGLEKSKEKINEIKDKMKELNDKGSLYANLADTAGIGATAAQNFFAPWKEQVKSLANGISDAFSKVSPSKINFYGGVGADVVPAANITQEFSISVPVNANISTETDVGTIAERVANVIVRRVQSIETGTDAKVGW